MEENMNQVEKDKNTKNNSLIIAILIVIILGLVGYIAYDKLYIEKKQSSVNTSNTTDKKDDKEERKELDINDAAVQKLFKIFTINNGTYMGQINNNNRVKLRIAFDNIPESQFKQVSCNDIELYDNRKDYCIGNTTSIDSNIMKEKIEELFGTDYKYKPEDFGEGLFCNGTTEEPFCSLIHYDSKNNLYARYNTGCGGDSCDYYKEVLNSAYTKGDKLYIKTTMTLTTLAEQSETREDALSTGIYTFKKDSKNGNYVFEKVVRE